MPRLRHRVTGVHINTSDAKAAGLAAYGYDPVDGGSDSEPPAGKYDGLKLADLRAEIASRNEGREENALIDGHGNKGDLIAALTADDSK